MTQNTPNKNKMISIVTTMYYSEPYLDEFYSRIKKTTEKITKNYEIIFVDDGSPDNALQKAVSFHKKDKRVKVIELSRNHGHHKAMMVGLSQTKGDYVFLIDCDLEEKPEWLPAFCKKLEEDKTVDVVYGIQIRRKGKFVEKYLGGFYYKIFNFFSYTKIPRNPVTARIMRQSYVKSLVQYFDTEPVFLGIAHHAGFKQISIPVEKIYKGKSTYTLFKKITILVNSITSFSSKPLRYIFYLGFFISFMSVVMIIYLIYSKFTLKTILSGWVSSLISIWLLGGLILLSIGVIGIYLEKMFIEIKKRPYALIKNIYS